MSPPERDGGDRSDDARRTLAALAELGAALAGARYPVAVMTQALPDLARAAGAERASLVRAGEAEIAAVQERLALGESLVLDAPERRLAPLHFAGTLWGAVVLEAPRAPLADAFLRGAAAIFAAALDRFRDEATRPTPTDARFDLLTDNASDIVAEIGPDGRFLYLNPRMEELTGWTRAELLGTSFADVIHPDDLAHVASTFQHLLELREPDPIRYRIRCRDGRWLWLESSGGTFTLPDGKLTTVVVSRDVTRRERSEAEVRQAQRLEAVGTLAGGIAHDFNNLLVGILGHASLLRDGQTSDAERREAVEVIEGAARRAADLTQQLLGFAGRAQRRLERIDVHATIEDLARLLARTIPRNVELSLRLTAPDAHVLGDPSQIQQVLLNLALNARDAMPDGGRLEIETRALADASGPPARLEIAVRDTGTGIPEMLRERIFEPFFTTKGPGGGSGMGLAVVYGIVTGHRGQVSVEGGAPRGTVFRITLPLAGPGSRPAAKAAPAGGDAAVRLGRGRVLVADDEPAVRSLAERMLRRLGYEVETAVDGLEAIAAVDGADAFDLVILDLDMPRMGGAECFRTLRARRPAARVLVSTGFGHPHVIDALLAEGLRGIVPKPYSLEQLARAVGDALRDEEAVADASSAHQTGLADQTGLAGEAGESGLSPGASGPGTAGR